MIDDKIRVRLSDSVETALKWGEGVLLTLHQCRGKVQSRKVQIFQEQVQGPAQPRATQVRGQRRQQLDIALDTSGWIETLHSNRNLSPATGKSYEPLTPKHFSFNAPAGACPVCHGLGQKMVFDEGLVVPDQEKSLEQGAILPWRRGGKRMVVYYKSMLRGVAAHYRAKSRERLTKICRRISSRCCSGARAETEIEFTFWRAGKTSKVTRPVRRSDSEPGTAVSGERKRIHAEPAEGFMSPQFCDACKGQRLKPEILAVTTGKEVQSPKSKVQGQPETPECELQLRPQAPEEAAEFARPHSGTFHSRVFRSWMSARFRSNGRTSFLPSSS